MTAEVSAEQLQSRPDPMTSHKISFTCFSVTRGYPGMLPWLCGCEGSPVRGMFRTLHAFGQDWASYTIKNTQNSGAHACNVTDKKSSSDKQNLHSQNAGLR